MTQEIPFSEEAPRRQGARSALFRQVSREAMDVEDLKSFPDGRGSPARCVSDFDKVAGPAHAEKGTKGSISSSISPNTLPAFRIPLHQPFMYCQHASALRLEVKLHPYRLILSRLMSHTTFNKKGIFNVPVDPVALNLPDYHSVVKRPMDLGSIKTKLYAIEYNSQEDLVEDIRLVFFNAMTYNPPNHAVHVAAKGLLAFFEEQLSAFVPEFEDPARVPCTPADFPKLHHEQDLSKVPANDASYKRKKRGSKKNNAHSCQWCEGRKCSICEQGCLQLEPTLLICNGSQCAGSRIRKGAPYYIAPDGSRQYCERCHVGLPPVLPNGASDDTCRYKRDLLKRKNDEELVESWLSCRKCDVAVHKICAMYNEFSQDESDFLCVSCSSPGEIVTPGLKRPIGSFATDEIYSYVSGATDPVPISELFGERTTPSVCGSEFLEQSSVSSFIQEKVRERLRSAEYPNADKTVTVRLVSDCEKHFKVPDVVRNHFRLKTRKNGSDEDLRPPLHLHYRSKAIALFQKIDGFDVCIFIMYVHEYEENVPVPPCTGSKRVYIAYLDSVEHFRPRRLRTSVYHEILVAYLATARVRGYESAHIWACPPSRGNSFVFWTSPGSQRTPTQERLTSWYHEALLKALDKGIMTDLKSLFESDFEPFLSEDTEDGTKCDNICPTLLDGDFWIEEAVRLHSINMNRLLKSRTADGCIVSSTPDRFDVADDPCPALEIASLLRDKIIANPIAFFFRKPVNAAALNLKDYHKVITRPMDLGTIYARCVLGEYATLKSLVDDVELVVSNAKKFNPPGHVVHIKADELRELFLNELNNTVKAWSIESSSISGFGARDVSLRLDSVLSAGSGGVNSGISESTQFCDKENDRGTTSSVSTILAGGSTEIERRMAGSDQWLLDKKPTSISGKGNGSSKKAQSRRRKSAGSVSSEPSAKRRRQTWLAEEVSASVRRMRTAFFSCSLKSRGSSSPDEKKRQDDFTKYTAAFNTELGDSRLLPSNLADARHALLEFSQFRNLQFDTLRRAKYSTAIFLYHLHNAEAQGVFPCCNGCGREINEVRWHKVGKVVETRRRTVLTTPQTQKHLKSDPFVPEELCHACIGSRSDKADFIPVQVSSFRA